MRATGSGFATCGAHATQSRKPSKVGLLIALMGALTLILSACNIGGGAAAGNISLASNQIFTWPYVDKSGIMGHNAVLDPAQITTYKDLSLVSMFYTNLVTFSPTLGIQPDAATSWDVSADGKTYTFHLRPNLKFSDGAPITAADFAYSLDRALDPNLCSVGSANTYAKVIVDPTTGANLCAQMGAAHLNYILGANQRVGIETPSIPTIISPNGDNSHYGLSVIDSQTLRIRLSSPIRFFLDSLTYPTGDVVERSLVENHKYAGGLWVDHLDLAGCSGPFKIKSYGAGAVMTLVPNPYWEQAFHKTLKLTQVVRPVISTVQIEYTSYRAGQYDYADVSLNQYQFARGQIDFHDMIALETRYFGLNFQQPPFNNLQVRQAFDLALDKQYLVDNVENGGAVPTNHIVPQGMAGYYPGLLNPQADGTQSLTGNVEIAKVLLGKAQASCASADPTTHPECPYIFGSSPQAITLYVADDDQTNVSIANAAALIWNQALGLNVRVKTVTFDTLVGYLISSPATDPMPMWAIGWIADYPDPEDFLTLQFTPAGGFDSEGINDPKLNSLLNSADTEQDPVKRMQMYNQAEQMVVEEVAWIPYQQSKIAWRLRTYVHGFTYNGLGIMLDVDWPNVYIAAH